MLGKLPVGKLFLGVLLRSFMRVSYLNWPVFGITVGEYGLAKFSDCSLLIRRMLFAGSYGRESDFD